MSHSPVSAFQPSAARGRRWPGRGGNSRERSARAPRRQWPRRGRGVHDLGTGGVDQISCGLHQGQLFGADDAAGPAIESDVEAVEVGIAEERLQGNELDTEQARPLCHLLKNLAGLVFRHLGWIN